MQEMYVLKRGVLEVLDDQGEQTRFGQGNIFGEMSILKAGGQAGKLLARRRFCCGIWSKTSTRYMLRHCLRSVGYSEVYLLSQEDALDVFADYPEQRQQLIQRGEKNKSQLKNTILFLSDRNSARKWRRSAPGAAG